MKLLKPVVCGALAVAIYLGFTVAFLLAPKAVSILILILILAFVAIETFYGEGPDETK